jgi:nucleosome assembly protein 1-like 1
MSGRLQIIPRAIDYFTGKALEYDDMGLDEEDEFDDDDDDDEEDEDEVSYSFKYLWVID